MRKKKYEIEFFTDVLDEKDSWGLKSTIVTNNIEKEIYRLTQQFVYADYGKYTYYIPGHKINYIRVRELD